MAAWPQADQALIDESLLADTATLLQAISLGRAARRSAGLKVRQAGIHPAAVVEHEGKIILASTHDPRLVERPEVSRVVELREGRVVD